MATVEGYIGGADQAITESDVASGLGVVKSRIGIEEPFVVGLMHALDRGVSTLVDADMNLTSTMLQAPQTKQHLGVQALSIANALSQAIQKLSSKSGRGKIDLVRSRSYWRGETAVVLAVSLAPRSSLFAALRRP